MTKSLEPDKVERLRKKLYEKAKRSQRSELLRGSGRLDRKRAASCMPSGEASP